MGARGWPRLGAKLMTTTFIDTNKIPRAKIAGAGEFAEILNKDLCGAKDVLGILRWLHDGESWDARCDANSHQLIYLMEGEGTITLSGREHRVAKGAGVYLGPSEAATIKATGSAPLKLLHLTVLKIRA